MNAVMIIATIYLEDVTLEILYECNDGRRFRANEYVIHKYVAK